MSTFKTVDQIEQNIDQQTKIMQVHYKNGKYADAEQSRLKIEQLKKDHQSRSLYDMNLKHKYQTDDLLKAINNQIQNFTALFNKKQDEVKQEEQKMEENMINRHNQQLQQLRRTLELQLSPRVKESSQLLNLRKMEEHMVKQKHFAEAHRVQQQILSMQSREKDLWGDKRNQRIEVALNTARNKQQVELTNLRKRYSTLFDQTQSERKRQLQILTKKHDNLLRDLKKQQQKQILNCKGQFKTRGGKDSPMKTRASFI